MLCSALLCFAVPCCAVHAVLCSVCVVLHSAVFCCAVRAVRALLAAGAMCVECAVLCFAVVCFAVLCCAVL